jgi:hypothetical protein
MNPAAVAGEPNHLADKRPGFVERRLRPGWFSMGRGISGRGMIISCLSRPLVVWILSAIVLVAAFHPLILGWGAGSLIVDMPVPPAATTVLLAGGDRQFDHAAGLLENGPCSRVLIQSDPPSRLVHVGILPAWRELCERELAQRGVSADRLTVQCMDGQRSWDSIRQIDTWLAEHPDEHLVVLADRFRSGNLAHLYRRVLSTEHRDRVTICGLADRRYDETNWWRSRRGMKAFLGAQISGLSVRWFGEARRPSVDPDPEAYERRLALP